MRSDRFYYETPKIPWNNTLYDRAWAKHDQAGLIDFFICFDGLLSYFSDLKKGRPLIVCFTQNPDHARALVGDQFQTLDRCEKFPTVSPRIAFEMYKRGWVRQSSGGNGLYVNHPIHWWVEQE